MDCCCSTHAVECVACPPEGMSTSALIDKMFEEVLQAADREEDEEKEEERQGFDHGDSESREEANVEPAETEPKSNSPNSSTVGDEESCDEEQKESKNSNEEEEVAGKREKSAVCNEEDFLSLPPSCILSPLSKSVEAVVTPMVHKLHMSVAYIHHCNQ